MKAKIVSIKEIEKDNPTLCLSALRFTGGCHKCRIFKQQIKYLTYKMSVEKAIKNMKCKPIITEEYIKAFKKEKKLLKELLEINKILGGD